MEFEFLAPDSCLGLQCEVKEIIHTKTWNMGWRILGIQLLILTIVYYNNLIYDMLQLFHKLSPHP